jgi:Transcription factor WhiB
MVMELCDGCGVRAPCAEYGLGGGTLLQGIWGGLNERQRRKRKKERKEAV